MCVGHRTFNESATPKTELTLLPLAHVCSQIHAKPVGDAADVVEAGDDLCDSRARTGLQTSRNRREKSNFWNQQAWRHHFANSLDWTGDSSTRRSNGLASPTLQRGNLAEDGHNTSEGAADFSMLLRAPNDLPTLRNYYSQITLIDDAVGNLVKRLQALWSRIPW